MYTCVDSERKGAKLLIVEVKDPNGPFMTHIVSSIYTCVNSEKNKKK